MEATPSLKELARRLGMSKSTVHRALSGHPQVSRKTRQLVAGAAAELGYRPDPLFSIMGSRGRARRAEALRIAYLTGTSQRPGDQGNVGRCMFPAIEEAGADLGYEVVEIVIDEFGAGERLMEVLYCRGYVGVVVGVVRRRHHPAILANRHLPVVGLQRADELAVQCVQVDVEHSVRLAWEKIVAKGYRRIGAAIYRHSAPVADDATRLGAVLSCQQRMPPDSHVPPLLAPLKDWDSFRRWYRRYKPDAILGFSMADYFKLLELEGGKLKTGYAALTNVRPTGIGEPVASIIEPEGRVMAWEAMHLLDWKIRRRQAAGPQPLFRVLVQGTWKEGTSLPEKIPTPAPTKRPRRGLARPVGRSATAAVGEARGKGRS